LSTLTELVEFPALAAPLIMAELDSQIVPTLPPALANTAVAAKATNATISKDSHLISGVWCNPI
jgi:hypothetical protein